MVGASPPGVLTCEALYSKIISLFSGTFSSELLVGNGTDEGMVFVVFPFVCARFSFGASGCKFGTCALLVSFWSEWDVPFSLLVTSSLSFFVKLLGASDILNEKV